SPVGSMGTTPAREEAAMKVVSVLAIVGVAGLASAARVVTVGFDADRTSAAMGETVTWTVRVSWIAGEFPDDAWLGGFVGDFVSNAPGLGQASGFESLMFHEATTPSGAGASVLGVNVFQSPLLDLELDRGNPIGIYRFNVLASAEGVLSYAVAGELQLWDYDFPWPVPFDVVSASDEVAIVPGVGGVWVLIGGGAVVRRRR
ncbi:MAG: hypothetical protein K8E66_02905, partial [Phycisphaerales bacterium]|nr:hypothetical protein [Phycisphaerales bacterium]